MKYLITGLGNPGEEYAFTRHNIGFLALEAIAKREGLQFETCKHGWKCTWKYKGRQIILLKPNTYMNLSGKAVQYWMQQEKISIENILVITDDLALPFGTIRLRGKGSDGGHNGLKSIQLTLNRSDYARLRFGIGSEFNKGQQVNYVLAPWSSDESENLLERLDACANLVGSFCTIGIAHTMTAFNNK
jgi:peptidyl-tRNA hydrolase, PTH1 family